MTTALVLLAVATLLAGTRQRRHHDPIHSIDTARTQHDAITRALQQPKGNHQ